MTDLYSNVLSKSWSQSVKRNLASIENAMFETYNRLQHGHLHYVIEFDIKGFFDNVNHVKLIRQMWTSGIRDKHLLGKI